MAGQGYAVRSGDERGDDDDGSATPVAARHRLPRDAYGGDGRWTKAWLTCRPPPRGPTGLDPVRRRVSVFLPAFNEVKNLEGALADIVWAADGVLAEYEVLVVNDGSTDGTRELADRLAHENPRVRALHQPRNMGIAAAYERALDEAKLDHFSFLAGDGEIARESVRSILAAVGRADIVAPYHQNPRARQLHRRFLTWASTTLVNVLFGFRMHYYQGPCIYPVALARA